MALTHKGVVLFEAVYMEGNQTLITHVGCFVVLFAILYALLAVPPYVAYFAFAIILCVDRPVTFFIISKKKKLHKI